MVPAKSLGKALDHVAQLRDPQGVPQLLVRLVADNSAPGGDGPDSPNRVGGPNPTTSSVDENIQTSIHMIRSIENSDGARVRGGATGLGMGWSLP